MHLRSRFDPERGFLRRLGGRAGDDAENATYIRLSDDSVEVRGLGATAVDGTVSVSAAGTYVVSGSIADGRIVVEAGDEDKVQIVLSNASVCSQDGLNLPQIR